MVCHDSGIEVKTSIPLSQVKVFSVSLKREYKVAQHRQLRPWSKDD